MPTFWGCRCCECKDDTHIGTLSVDVDSPNHVMIRQLQIETGGVEWSLDINAEDGTKYGAVAPLKKGQWTSVGKSGRIVVDSSGVLDRITETFGPSSGIATADLKFRYKRLSLPNCHGTVSEFIDPQSVDSENSDRLTFDGIIADHFTGIYQAHPRKDGGFVVCGNRQTSLGGGDFQYEIGFWVYDDTGTEVWSQTWERNVISGVTDNQAQTFGVAVDRWGAIYHYGKDESDVTEMRKYSSGGSLIWNVAVPSTVDGKTVDYQVYPKEVIETSTPLLVCFCQIDSNNGFINFDIYDGSITVVKWPSALRSSETLAKPWDLRIARWSQFAVVRLSNLITHEVIFAGWPVLDDVTLSWSKKASDGDEIPSSGNWAISEC